MRVLIVEDDENKRAQLSQFLRETYPSVELRMEGSLQGGVRRIRREPPDLVLLDMTLPTYDVSPDEPGGGSTHSFGGREFLQQMDRFDITVPVLVVTQFETFGKDPQKMDLPELDAQLRAEHAPVYCGAVYYHAAIHGWKEHLRVMIAEALGGNC